MESFFCDFHIHSCLSPCADITMTPNEIARVCCERGIDWIAITDHNSAGNVRVFTEVLKRLGIAVIPGMEIHTLEDVHVLAYFPDISVAEEYSRWLLDEKLNRIEIDPEISGYQLYAGEDDSFTSMENIWLGQPALLGIDEAISTVEERGGVCVLAHVDRKMGLVIQLGFIPENYRDFPVEVSFKESLKKIDLKTDNIIHSSDAHSLNLVRPTISMMAEKRTFDEFRLGLISGGKRVKIIWD